MKVKKHILRAVSCAVATAVMTAMILTGCGGTGGAASSSGSTGTGNSGNPSSGASSSASSSSSSTASSASSSGSTASAKATKILQYVNGAVQADYKTWKTDPTTTQIVTHYTCAVSGENVYVLTYEPSGKAGTAFVQADGEIYAIDGKYKTKAPGASGQISSGKVGCNFPTAAEAATMTTGKYTVEGKEYDAEILKKTVYGHPVSYIYCFEGNVLKYRVVSGLYYNTKMEPIEDIVAYNSITTKVDAKLFDLSGYQLML